MRGVELMIPSIGFGHPFNCGSGILRGKKVVKASWEDWGEFSVQGYLNMESNKRFPFLAPNLFS
jgi:hypothetical protein